MNELQQKIESIINRKILRTQEDLIKQLKGVRMLWPSDIEAIELFISKCSLSDFEKLKDLEYDLNQTNE